MPTSKRKDKAGWRAQALFQKWEDDVPLIRHSPKTKMKDESDTEMFSSRKAMKRKQEKMRIEL